MDYTVRRPAGQFFIFGPEGDVTERDSLQCVHCQRVWAVEPGSGRKRGFCFRCNGPTCGKKACVDGCVPFEKAIEQMEARGRLLREVDAAVAR